MTLYLVKDGDRKILVAYERNGAAQLFAWVPNTRRFHLNVGLTQDFYWDQDCQYEPITADTARALMEEGEIGKLDRRKKRVLLERYEADTHGLSAAEVLGGAPLQADRPSRALR